jgi:hypothetical protein
MHRRLCASILFALVLAWGHQVTMAASPLYVVCGLPNATDLYIVVESFETVGGAVQQCVQTWRGIPRGIMR